MNKKNLLRVDQKYITNVKLLVVRFQKTFTFFIQMIKRSCSRPFNISIHKGIEFLQFSILKRKNHYKNDGNRFLDNYILTQLHYFQIHLKKFSISTTRHK